MTHRVPDLRRGGVLDLFRGFAIPFRALGLLRSTKRLSRLVTLVASITPATLILLFVALLKASPALVTALLPTPDSSWERALQVTLTAAVFVVLFVIGANALPFTFAAPLMDPISSETERTLGAPGDDAGGLTRLLRETFGAFANGLVRLGVLLAGHAILFPLWLVPGPGTLAWTALAWLWTAACLALQYLDVPMARHLYGWRAEVALLRRRFALLLGFGAAITLMLWVPLLNFFFVPVAVVGGTMLFRGLVAAGELELDCSDGGSKKS